MNFKNIQQNLKNNIFTVDESTKALFDNFKSEIHRDLESLTVILSNMKQKMEVAPVMKWGQSNSEVHIFLKLSHRFDSPGCLELIKEPETSFESGKLKFKAECVQASYPMIFVLDFEVYEGVDKMKIEKMSIGNYRIILTKIKEDIWEDLFKNFDDRNKFTLKIWYELEDRYPAAMEEFYTKMDKYFKTKKEEKKKKANKVAMESCPAHLRVFITELKEALRVRYCVKKKAASNK